MSVGRRGPLSFLDTEWRTALWKRWVASHLVNEGSGAVEPPAVPVTPVTPAVPTNGHAAAPVTPVTPARPSESVNAVHTDAPVTSGDVLEAARAVARRMPPADHGRNERRADVRARFDALSERLQGVEDAIDVIARRLSQRSRRERRTDRRTAELVETIAENVEAHAIALDNVTAALERLERRLERLDRSNARDEGREPRAPKQRNSEPPRSVHPPRLDDTGDFSLSREASEEEDPSISGSSIRGSIGDMSLSTLLAMLEIERRSGRLKVQADDGSLVAFELEEGSVVGSRVSENDVDAVESLREVLTWKNGRFWFRQNPTDSQVAPPRSVNSLLLEATRQIDEAIRVG